MNLTKLTFAAATIALAGAIFAPSAQAQMNDNYVGGHGAISHTKLDITFFTLGISGRYKIPGSNFSARVALDDGFKPTATYDIPLDASSNAYVGGGLNIDGKASPLIQIGAEKKLSKNIVLYGGADYTINGFSDFTGKVGVGYSF